MTTIDDRRDRASWRPFAAGCFAFFTIMAGATIPTPLYPLYAEAFGFTSFTITVIFAAYSAGVIGALLLTGPWSDEIGRKPLLLGGLATAALAALAFALAHGLPLLLIARVLQGMSVGVFTSAATVAVTELAPEGHPRLGGLGATAANMGGLGAGSILSAAVIALMPAPLLTPYLVHLAMVALAVGLLWGIPEPGERARDPRLHAQGLAIPPAVRGLFVPAALAAFAGFMVCGFLGAVAPAYLGRILGHQGEHLLIGVVAGLIFLASCLGQIAEDRLPDSLTLPIGMGLLSLGIAAITAALWFQSLAGLMASIVFAGLGHGIAFKGGLSALGRNAPAGQASAVTATYFTVAYVAISIPVLIIGALEDPLGLARVAVGYGAVSTVLSAIAFVIIAARR